MKTLHRIFFENAKAMKALSSASVDLVVTSPPYPMIQMWDDMFIGLDRRIDAMFLANDGLSAFEKMHGILDEIWDELWRVVAPGGIVCINIGDAVRTVGDNFSLYTNHSRIISKMRQIGFQSLPAILWRKATNAPNKFMGSGMLPPGAYATLEHEYILIFRKGGKREFVSESKQTRRESAYFWEERNIWFSDVWMNLIGTRQDMKEKNARLRSAAFPFEIPFRLINMFSVKGDTVLDPFLGTGTTIRVAAACCRNSVGYEIESGFLGKIKTGLEDIVCFSNNLIETRLRNHEIFIQERAKEKGVPKHMNKPYGFPVITAQEKELFLNPPEKAEWSGDTTFEVSYGLEPSRPVSKKFVDVPLFP